MKLTINKISILIFILIFLNSYKLSANDIYEFEIDGISIGESLLNYYSEREIIENRQYYNEEDDFITSEFYIENIDSNYDLLSVYYKKNDENYIVYHVSGTIFYDENISECYSMQKMIVKNISELLNNAEAKYDELNDEDGFFTFSATQLISGIIEVSCYDWSKYIENEFNWVDNLSVTIENNEFSDWVDSIDTTYSN